jgi:hypothetical protein
MCEEHRKRSGSSGTTGHLQIQIDGKPERLGSREMQEISVVAKAAAAEDFFASFFGLSKKEESENDTHSL